VIQGLEICKTPWQKARGMMFRTHPVPLLFVFNTLQIVPLHMVFVWFPIDVIFLDEKCRIVEIKQNFRPFTFLTPKKKAKFILETEVGFVQKKKWKVGTCVEIPRQAL
jgi:uncharacterized membrane protein (UPF0127 family)